MTDHKAEAMRVVARWETDSVHIVSATIAQVHATLYLAEQQRIANLIALLPALDNTVKVDRFDMDRPLPTERDTVLAEIREGLGLS